MRKSGKKVLGNFLVAFVTAWLSANIVGFGNEAFYFALFNAIMLGLLSTGNELLAQCNVNDETPPKKALSLAVLV